MPVYINGSNSRDIQQCGATHMFHHSQWGATFINHQEYPSNIMYVDKIRFGENNVKDTIRVMAMKRLSNIVATAYLQILFRKKGYLQKSAL